MFATLNRLLWLLCLAALALSARAADLRVAVISDLNGNYGSTSYDESVHRAVRRIVELKPDLVISTGDMVAGQRLHPPFARQPVERMWAAFHRAVSDPLQKAGIPLVVTPGNHDASIYPKFILERAIFEEQWRPRRAALNYLDQEGYPFRYAFGLGDALFIALDVTRPGQLDRAQREWLERLLQRHGKDYARRVVFSHLPLWPFSVQRETEVSGDKDLERLLRQEGVDLYLSGHHHSFYPGYKDGLRLVGQACLGAGPRSLIGGKRREPQGFTWIEIGKQRLHLGSLLPPDFTRPLAPESLPEQVRSPLATLIRLDRVHPEEFGDGR